MGILTYLGFIQMFSNIKILCRQIKLHSIKYSSVQFDVTHIIVTGENNKIHGQTFVSRRVLLCFNVNYACFPIIHNGCYQCSRQIQSTGLVRKICHVTFRTQEYL